MTPEYAWLGAEPGPKMLLEAMKLYGVTEIEGDKHSPVILAWADEVGLGTLYTADETPWCGLFIAVVAKRAGKPIPANPLWARNWAKWGSPCAPSLGCVLVFSRETGGHVGLYVGEDPECYHVLGGNQGNRVCIKRLAKNRLIAARELYRMKPGNIRPVRLAPTGEVSRNEG